MKQHTYVTEKEWRRVRGENKKLVESFITFCQENNRPPLTIKVYESDLKIFMIWILHYSNNKSFTKLTKRDISYFQNWAFNTMKLSYVRIKHLKLVASSLSNYIVDNLKEQYPDYENIITEVKLQNNEIDKEELTDGK